MGRTRNSIVHFGPVPIPPATSIGEEDLVWDDSYQSCKSSVESVDGICVEIDRDGVA
jgi:hypothetical protein